MALIWKDVLTELRSKDVLATTVTFAILILVVFNFSLSLSTEIIPMVTPAVLWISFIFAGVLGLGRSFATEIEAGSIYGLLLTPVDRSVLYLGKMMSNLVFVLVMEFVTLPLFTGFFNVNLFEHASDLLVVVLLGTIGFVSVGTLFSAMAVNTRLREVLLPILLFPIIMPVIISAVRLTDSVLQGRGIATEGGSLKLLVSFDIIFLVVCSVVFEYVIED
ncbi:MAG: heme exporter protein CcmB [Candidatus Methanosuratincola sp.]